MQRKVIVFHPALAPYRIDFFNAIHEAFDVSFYFEHENPLEQKFNREELNKRVHFTYSYLVPGLFGIKNLRLSVFNILRREKPAMAFVSEYNLIGVIVLFYKFIFDRKLKMLITCDDNVEMVSSVGLIKRLVRAALIRWVDLVLVVNDQVKNWYEKNFTTKAKFFYFPIIQSDIVFGKRLEDSLFLAQKIRDEYNLNEKKIVLYVGRLVKVKNVSVLLDAYVHYCDNHNDAVLLIVGDGEERSALEQRVMPYIQKGQIIFVGKKEGLELMAYYNLGEIFVLPSVYEPFGTVTNEALLSGCYVLCSNRAGSSCLIKDGWNGALFDPMSKQELVCKLEESLQKVSKERGNRMLSSFDEYVTSFVKCIKSII